MHFALTFLSSVLLYIPYLVSFYMRFTMKRSFLVSLLSFIFTWIIIEICHDLNLLLFPYLTLGHVLAGIPELIQWYECTGVIGGTVWIFLINSGIYLLASSAVKNKNIADRIVKIKYLIFLLFIFVLPALTSLYLQSNQSNMNLTTYNAVSVHTNADVYHYKYEVEPEVLLDSYLKLTLSKLDTTKNNIVVWPENALTNELYLNSLDSSRAIVRLKDKLCNNSKNVLITGAIVKEKVERPDSNLYLPNILYDIETQSYFRHYNSALLIRGDSLTLIKTKKRLIPFSEKIPSQKIFSSLVSLFPNLADLRFSSMEDEYPVFTADNNNIRTDPVICYGSAFSSFVADETLNSRSNLLVFIMNEGWMKSVKAYNHFNWFAVCRSIENRRMLVKSSNEGMSAIINEKGEVEKSAIGSKADVLTNEIRINENYTFFTRYHTSIYMSLLIVGFLYIFSQFLIAGNKELFRRKHRKQV